MIRFTFERFPAAILILAALVLAACGGSDSPTEVDDDAPEEEPFEPSLYVLDGGTVGVIDGEFGVHAGRLIGVDQGRNIRQVVANLPARVTVEAVRVGSEVVLLQAHPEGNRRVRWISFPQGEPVRTADLSNLNFPSMVDADEERALFIDANGTSLASVDAVSASVSLHAVQNGAGDEVAAAAVGVAGDRVYAVSEVSEDAPGEFTVLVLDASSLEILAEAVASSETCPLARAVVADPQGTAHLVCGAAAGNVGIFVNRIATDGSLTFEDSVEDFIAGATTLDGNDVLMLTKGGIRTFDPASGAFTDFVELPSEPSAGPTLLDLGPAGERIFVGWANRQTINDADGFLAVYDREGVQIDEVGPPGVGGMHVPLLVEIVGG